MTRIRSAVLVAGLLIASSSAIAAPASAAELPPESQIATADESGSGAYLVNPATGALTLLSGDDTTNIVDWDVDDTGQGYAVGYEFVDGPQSTSIWDIDLAAGTISAPRDLRQGDQFAACLSVDYTAGVLLANCVVQDLDGGETSFGTIDTTSGQYTPIWSYSETTEAATALSIDPTTGDTYFFINSSGNEGPLYTLFRLHLAEETFEVIGDVGGFLLGADFDSNGVLWASFAEDISDLTAVSLATVDVATGAATLVGPMEFADSEEPGTYIALTVWGPAALADTGVDATIPASLALLTLAAGAVALTFHRRRRIRA